jgi:hypothetical protein
VKVTTYLHETIIGTYVRMISAAIALRLHNMQAATCRKDVAIDSGQFSKTTSVISHTREIMRVRNIVIMCALSAVFALSVSTGAASADETGPRFLAETEQAMSTMDAGMMAKPTGNVDHDFVQMMVPHHQGAINMAVAELRYGHDEQLKRIAQEIIVDQQQEIAAMRLALGQPLPASVAVPTQAVPHHHAGMSGGQDQ